MRGKDARAVLWNIFDISIGELPQSTYRRRTEIGRVYLSTLTAGSYTKTLFVKLDIVIVKGGGRAPPPSPSLG